MSDKVREFVEIPQQFVRDGNQVRHLCSSIWTLLFSLPFTVPYTLHQTFSKGFAYKLTTFPLVLA